MTKPTAFARQLRGEMTGAERRLWHRLRRKQINGHRFRRQVPLGTYVADFVCLSARLVVEVDGIQHDVDDAHEARRTEWLERDDFRILRYGNREVLMETDRVVEDIWRNLGGQ